MDDSDAIFQWLEIIYEWQKATYELVEKLAISYGGSTIDPAKLTALKHQLKTSADQLKAAVAASKAP